MGPAHQHRHRAALLVASAAAIAALLLAAATTPIVSAASPSGKDVDVFFAPYDSKEDLTIDLASIQEVIAARKAHNRSEPYPPEENPFRIQFCVYNLLDMDYVNATIEAFHANVYVQVLMHYQQLSEPYVPTWRVYKAAGLNVAASPNVTQRDVNATQRAALNLLGIRASAKDYSALMHMKTRYFSWLDPTTGQRMQRLATGSMNPEDAALHNDETLLVYHDEKVIAQYMQFYNATLNDLYMDNTYDAAEGLNVLYSRWGGTSVRDVIFGNLRAEQELVLVWVYALRDLVDPWADPRGNFVETMCRKKRDEDVPVVVLTDKGEVDGEPGFASGDFSRTAARLAACDIPVYKCNNTAGAYNAFHHKNAMFGITKPVIFTDTANWSEASLGSSTNATNSSGWKPENVESTLVLRSMQQDDGITAYRFLSNMLANIRKYAFQQHCPYVLPGGTVVRDNCAGVEPFNQSDWNMPNATNVTRELQARVAAWPVVATTFTLSDVPASASRVSLTVSGDESHVTALMPSASSKTEWSTERPVPLKFGSLVTYTFSVDGAPLAQAGSPLTVDAAHDWENGVRRADADVRDLVIAVAANYTAVGMQSS